MSFSLISARNKSRQAAKLAAMAYVVRRITKSGKPDNGPRSRWNTADTLPEAEKIQSRLTGLNPGKTFTICTE